MTDSSERNFDVPAVSISGAPEITYRFRGDTVRAELVGAKLYGEYVGDDRIELRLTDATGEVLADVRLNPCHGRTTTENVMDVGSALLWSHWRYLQAQAPASGEE